eukprot:CAMPEP_0173365720 /NCGR_PEP_ID=MMETSP1144-20121109/23797_1 /TAXON_ID=483371 /ORGANISM="non described non described, Strain CCMP2298" /LENGTH=114 /DNA_ID=CAMNT_0014316211 /DNA_START=122 /DNA_END=463 /DNA_ORIENTATION=+
MTCSFTWLMGSLSLSPSGVRPRDAATEEAAASTSHFALATEAAAAKRAAPDGKITVIIACTSTMFTSGRSSTDAALAAAHRPAKAEVKGKMDRARALVRVGVGHRGGARLERHG